jgi:hypothetical protein
MQTLIEVGSYLTCIDVLCCVVLCCVQLERGWSTTEVRQWAQRVGLVGAGGCLVLTGFMKSPGEDWTGLTTHSPLLS